MKRFLVLVVSLVASLVGILAPASATELPSASVVTYTYDGHHAPAQFAAAAPQRGPPVAYDVNSYDADDLRPLGALARSDGPAPVSTTITYVNPGTSVRVARDTTPTGSWVGPTVENPSSFQRSAIAANAAPKALAASTRAAPWAGSTLSRLSREGEVMYRVYGGGAGKAGSWLTPINPASSAAARQGLGLPAENAALYVSRVTLPGGVRMQVGTAGEAFGQPGGWAQAQLLERIPLSSFGKGVPLP